MKIERFEDLICWQKARTLTNVVYSLTRLAIFAKDFELVRQIRSAAISSMSNIAEGFDRWSRKELVRFLDIAKGSAGEVWSQLYVALDQQYINAEQFDYAIAATLEPPRRSALSLVISNGVTKRTPHANPAYPRTPLSTSPPTSAILALISTHLGT